MADLTKNVVGAQKGAKLFIQKGTANNLQISTDGRNWSELDYYTLPSGTSGQVLTIGTDGTAAFAALPTATSSTLGIVRPDNDTITINNGVIKAELPDVATTTSAGLMSADDKAKIDGLVVGYLGYYATETALKAAHSTGQDGYFANVGATDTIWAWDSDTNSWTDTNTHTTTISWANVSNKPIWATDVQGTGDSEQLKSVRVYVADAGNYYTGSSVEAALQEVGASISTLQTTQDKLIYGDDEYAFTTTETTGETMTFTAAQLGTADKVEYSVIDSDGLNVTTDVRISRKWTSSGYVVTFAGDWPVGSWTLKPMGLALATA